MLAALLVVACRATPVNQWAQQSGLAVETATGNPFIHRVFRKQGQGSRLHIYIEGDGRAWLSSRRIALDPTPRESLTLELMLLDPAPAAAIGRPCYFDVSDPACSPRWWTSHRYAVEVVESLSAVITQYAADFDGVILIGHSGGGTLAMLIAAMNEKVEALVTIGGNLDIRAWTQRHGFSPLVGSRNPALQPPLPHSIVQHHYLGSEDQKIFPDMIRPVVDRQANARLVIVDEFNHRCCWQRRWNTILDDLQQALGENARRETQARFGPGKGRSN